MAKISKSERAALKAAAEAPIETVVEATPIKGKLGLLVSLLARPGGARIDEMMAATGWQAHSIRGAISGSLKKARGLTIISEKTEATRTYRMCADART